MFTVQGWYPQLDLSQEQDGYEWLFLVAKEVDSNFRVLF